jgi:hypothetical protein
MSIYTSGLTYTVDYKLARERTNRQLWEMEEMSHRKKMTRKHKKLYQSTSGRYFKVKTKKKS